MRREAYALAAGFATNIGGYVLALVVLKLIHADTPSALSLIGPFLWLASMILGGWIASVVAGGRRYFLGYLSAAMGMLFVVLVMVLVANATVPLLATAAGIVMFSAFGALGALTYVRRVKP
jgi:hypothetical protein